MVKNRSNIMHVCVYAHIKREPLDICSTLCSSCSWKKEHMNFFYAELPALKLNDVFLKTWYF